jgi:hypothetical protein
MVVTDPDSDLDSSTTTPDTLVKTLSAVTGLDFSITTSSDLASACSDSLVTALPDRAARDRWLLSRTNTLSTSTTV